MKIRDLIWPSLENVQSQRELDVEKNKDFIFIRTCDISCNTTLLREEISKLYALEQERRASADAKAGLYLTAVAALIAFFASFTPNFDEDFSAILMPSFSMAFIQLMRCGLWSLRALEVKGNAVLDWKNLIRLSSHENLEVKLSKKLLASLRFNYDQNNQKLSKVNMAHATLVSAVAWLSTVIVLKILQPFILSAQQEIPILCAWCNFSLA
ncbi:hypothetical protein [Vibrio sp. SCSIO 43169]|uniref:hypothetical protein n=1 Tax=Vibrio sp. SCSIO 43169 TaxID=2822801 RepID=UPI0020435C03|nr:hypothetical protein [Vibrio sp. SCSIO 43169]MCM5507145.1 hypothetical protein [Vibrio sp. SCSIO 43169]